MKSVHIFILLSCFFVAQGLAQAPDKIIFSHQFHLSEADAECTDCHGKVKNSLDATDNLLPEMETCYSCHDEDDTECSLCHSNPDEAGLAPRNKDFAAKFPHKQHINAADNCLNCHTGIDKKTEVGNFHVPGSATCTNCHGAADFKEEQIKCLTCHDKEMDFEPSSHALNWSKDHGLNQQIGNENCSHCHQASYCQNCHQGDNLDSEVHPLNFRLTHGSMAKANKENCLTCHEEQLFCLDCHQTQMVMPKNHSYVNWSNRIPGNGGRHAKEAKFDFDNCMSCHNDTFADNVCVTCHGK